MGKEQTADCAVCGRRAGRSCPALDGIICNSCCGARRGTRINCPPECSHFPFGRKAYDRWLRVDLAWHAKAVKYVLGKVGEKEFTLSAENCAPPWIEGDSAFIEGADYALIYYLTTAKSDGAASIGEIWKREGWPGLNNDERYMAEYRCQSIPAIIEVQKIHDDTAMECIDLLDMERGRFTVFDRNTAGSVARFARIVTWITHYPHFTRPAASGVDLPEKLVGPFLSEIRLRAEEALNRQSDEAVKQYLAEHFVETFELIDELRAGLRKQLIASLDADLCRAYYKLLAPRVEIESILEEKPDFEIQEDREREPGDPPDATYYCWLRRGEAKRIEKEVRELIQHLDEKLDGVGVLGSVRLTDDELMVETKRKVFFEFAKKLTRSYFKKRLELVDEEITPFEVLLEKYAASDGKPEEFSSGVPPEIERPLIKKFYEKDYSEFLDRPLPMIDNMTPREASHRPAMRPKLIELVKLHLHHMDRIRIEKGVDVDIGWIVDELGLDELK